MASLRPPLRIPSALAGLIALAATGVPTTAQSLGDAGRLAGVMRVQTRVEAEWDEAITLEAGGATPDQFLAALRQTFEETLSSADAAPSVVPGADATVACHVDTYYETGLIVYSLRTQLERPGSDGQPVVVWIRSWVGSFRVQQLHLMFALGEQCAESFLEDWRSVN